MHKPLKHNIVLNARDEEIVLRSPLDPTLHLFTMYPFIRLSFLDSVLTQMVLLFV
jgi:hypothetical protein